MRAAFAAKMKRARAAKGGRRKRRKNPTKAEVKAAAAKIAKAAGKLAWRGAKLTGRIGRESAKAAAREVKASICRTRTKNPKQKLRISHIVDWSRGGQGFTALIRGKKVIGRYSNMKDAQAAYRAARARRRNPKRKSIRRRRANPIFRVVIKAVPKGEYRKRSRNPTAPLYYDGKNFTSNKAKRRTFSSVQPAEVVARHLLHRFPILRKGYVVTLNSV
jgi:hypothetical protein